MITEKLIINEVTMEVFNHPERCNSDCGERCYYLTPITSSNGVKNCVCAKYATKLYSRNVDIYGNICAMVFLKCGECIDNIKGKTMPKNIWKAKYISHFVYGLNASETKERWSYVVTSQTDMKLLQDILQKNVGTCQTTITLISADFVGECIAEE